MQHVYFILSPSGGENPQFLPFFGFRHLAMSTVGGNLRNLNTGAQLQTFSYPMAWNYFCTLTPSWRNLAHKLWRSKAWRTEKAWRTTMRDGQTKNSTCFAAPAAGEIRGHQTWHGNRGPRARSCTSKSFGGLTHSFAARGHWKFVGYQTPVKTPITPLPLGQIQRNLNI